MDAERGKPESGVTSGWWFLADVGGTNIRCALYPGSGSVSSVRVYNTSDFTGLEHAIRAYVRDVEAPCIPSAAAIAVAAPVNGDQVCLTNSGWKFSCLEIRTALGFEHLHVVNDFAAVALALPHLQASDLVKIGAGRRIQDGNIAVIGPGTGLGVSALIHNGSGYTPVVCEGGHATLCANSDRQARVIELLRDRFGHVSAERVLSGPGLVNLYQVMTSAATVMTMRPEDVSAGARAGDRDARAALDMMFEFLGVVAGNLALTFGATGGIYVAGGILPALESEMLSSAFRHQFEAKGRYHDYLCAIPTYLIRCETSPALLGLTSLLEGPKSF